MATTNLNQNLGHLNVIDKRRVPDSATAAITSGTFIASQSTATIDAALSSAYWTQARLDATCLTDKLHALRMAGSDAAGVS